MEENSSWKIIIIAALFSLAVLGVAYYLISPRDAAYFSEEPTEKIAEFKHTRVEGRKEGKRVWEFYAESGWTDKNQQLTRLHNVSRGRTYKDGKLLITDLSAPFVKVYRQADVVEVFGQPEGKTGPSGLRASIDLGKISAAAKPKSAWTKIISDRIKYLPDEKRSEIAGNVVLSKRDTLLKADAIGVDHDKKIANLAGNIRLDRKDGFIRGSTVEYFGETEELKINGQVTIDIREGRIKTLIECRQAACFLDTSKDILLSGSIEVIQGKKVSVADEGVYSKKKTGLILKGNTKTALEKGQALLKEETAHKLGRPEVKEILREKTLVAADEIFFSTKTGDANAAGRVEVTQKGREARSDRAYYDDKLEILKLTDKVYMKKTDEWIECKQAVISVTKETFDAVGVTGARFKL